MSKKLRIIISFVVMIIMFLFTNNAYASTLSTDINSIDDSKYPGIKSLIKTLQSAHPSWKFQVEYTGLDFEEVIFNECQGHGTSPMNLAPANNSRYSGMWICPICGTRLYDSGKWYCASEHAVKYMMDPRNCVNESDVFQFLDLSYTDGSTISNEKVDVNVKETEDEIIPTVTVETLKQKYPNCVIKESTGADVTDGKTKTGQTITIDGKTYTLIKKGDVTKDGEINIVDVVNMLNCITGKVQLDDVAKNAGKVSANANLCIVDVVNVLNAITGKQTITISTQGTSGSNTMAESVKQMAKSISYLDDECIQTILKVSNEYNVNPLYLMVRIYQEQGAGTSPLCNGSGYQGQYQGVYNLYNINAAGNSKDKVILNGLAYAEKQGWTSKAKAIEGGAKIIANSYISKNQDTPYYQKFNVVGTNTLYSHQYMQNVLAAQTEGTTQKKNYKSVDPNLTNTYVFTIPLYENMPKDPCPRPDTETSSSEQYEEKEVSVASSLYVRSTPSSSGTVLTSLKNGYKVKVIETTSEMIDGHYWSLIICDSTGAYGYVASEYLK